MTVLIKFDGKECAATACGYSGSNPAVAGILAAMMGTQEQFAAARSNFDDKMANLGVNLKASGISLGE